MSVLKRKRGRSNAQFLDNALQIAETAMRVSKEFPKRFGMTFTMQFVNASIDGLDYVKMANSLYPSNQLEAEKRQLYFKEAIAKYENFATLIELGERSFGIQTMAQEMLGEVVLEEIRLLKGIIRSDKERYKF